MNFWKEYFVLKQVNVSNYNTEVLLLKSVAIELRKLKPVILNIVEMGYWF